MAKRRRGANVEFAPCRHHAPCTRPSLVDAHLSPTPLAEGFAPGRGHSRAAASGRAEDRSTRLYPARPAVSDGVGTAAAGGWPPSRRSRFSTSIALARSTAAMVTSGTRTA